MIVNPCNLLLLLVIFLSELLYSASSFVLSTSTRKALISSSLPSLPRVIVNGRSVIKRERSHAENESIRSRLNMSSASSGEALSASQEYVGPTKEELDAALRVAVEAAKKASEIIMGHTGGAEVTERKANSRDLLTLIDPLCEQAIRDTILATFPDHDFLGEEDVPPGAEASAAAIEAKLSNSDSDWLWIVDPIDGTTNFAQGMPLCAPSVAAAHRGRVVVGVVHDPHRDETFSATLGGGAFLDGERLSVENRAEVIGDAVIAMGSPPGAESLRASLKGVEALMPRCRTIRMLGSAAIMLAWVACGRLDVYWEYDLSSWDVAAGALLITEAGGSFTGLDGEPWDLRVRKIMASSGSGTVHEEVLQILNEAGV